MNTLSWIIDDSFSTRLTFALLHFLWQGCCAGVVVYFGGFLLRTASARIRYSLNVAVMLAMAACLPTTFCLVNTRNNEVEAPHVSETSHKIDDAQIPFASLERTAISDAEQFSADPAEWIRPNESIAANTMPTLAAPLVAGTATQATWLEFVTSNAQTVFPVFSRWIAVLYFCGVAMILGRLMRGVWGGRQLRKMATVITETALLEAVRRLAHQVGLKAAPTVAWCEQISIPVVVGVVQPMILLPAAIVSGLTPVQLQALLLHELSHIRRLDPIVNLLQRIIEAILFFHPVVWFVSRRISCERENAADDMVLAAGWDRPLYADALVRVAELATALSKPDAALRATILSSAGTTPSEFKLRILRLLGSRPPKLDVSRAGFTMALALVIMAGSGILAWSQSSQSGTSSDKAASNEDSVEIAQESTRPVDKLEFRFQVNDVQGKPVAGAKVTPISTLRVPFEFILELDRNWCPEVTSDVKGIALVTISKGQFKEERFKVAAVLADQEDLWETITDLEVRVDHPEYPVWSSYLDASDPPPIELVDSSTIEVRARRMDDNEPLRDVMPLFASYDTSPADWLAMKEQSQKEGLLTIRRVDLMSELATRWLRLVHVPEEGPAWFSDLIDLKSLNEKSPILLNPQLRPGVQVAGRLADSVPRPVENGRVVAKLTRGGPRATEFLLDDADLAAPIADLDLLMAPWSFALETTINKDGSFVFESVPADENLQIIALCDGWVSRSPTDQEMTAYAKSHDFVIDYDGVPYGEVYPQIFRTTSSGIKPIVPMERTSDCKVTVVDETGQPISAAKVSFEPNQCWFQYGSEGLGMGYDSLKRLQIQFQTGEPPKRPAEYERFQAKTNSAGIAVIRNLPLFNTDPTAPTQHEFSVYHDDYIAPPCPDSEHKQTVLLRPDQPGRVTLRMKAKKPKGDFEQHPGRAEELLETELLRKLVRGGKGKIDTKTINAWITLVAARGAQDAEFARLVLAEFEKSYEGGDLNSQSRRHLLAVLTDIFETWSSPGWRSQLRRFRPDDLPQAPPPQVDAKLGREILARVIQRGYETDRSELANFSLAVRQLHDPAGREFLRNVLRIPGSESNLPETVPAEATQGPKNNPKAPTASRWKDNTGGGCTDAKFVAAVGLAELGEAEGIDWLLARAQPNKFGIDASLWSFPHIRDSRGSLRECSRLALADLFGLPAQVTVTELGDWWLNNRAKFTARPVMLKLRAGRGSPDPVLDPTAGLPNSDEETKTVNTSNGDLRSNPAAGSEDPRRVPKAAASKRSDPPGDRAVEKTQERVAIQDVVRGVDFLRVKAVGFEEALLRTPELHVPDPKNPGTWDRPKNVFQMPLGEHTWLKYPAGSGHFYIEHRPDGSPEGELLYGPIEGDPFEVLKLDDFFREKLKPDSKIVGSDPRYRLRLMFRTAEPSLMQRAWQFIEPVLSRKFSNRNEPGFFERLEILEIARDGLREQVAANKSAELVELGQRMRDVIGAAEASVDAINDSEPDASYQSATYLQPKIQAQLPDALWGKPVSGLRLGLVPRESGPDSEWDALPADASLPTTIQAKPGEPLHYLLMVENVSDAEIKFCGYVGGEEMARSVEILDHKGQPAWIDSLHTDIPHFISHWRLKPRERMLLTIPAIHFHPVSPDSPTKGLGYHVTAANGRYSLRCSYHFGDLDTSRQRHIPGKTEWIGKLTTGTQTITVGDPEPRRDGDNSDTRKRSRLPALQGTWTVETMNDELKDALQEVDDQRAEIIVKDDLLTVQYFFEKKLISLPIKLEWKNGGPPQAVDLVFDPNGDADRALGIIEIDAERLRICFSEVNPPDEQQRPKIFAAGSKVSYFECRSKKTKPEPLSRAGRGSPDPALDPTAGLPNSDEETNQPNNANGDLRSKPAAGSGDPRPAQKTTSPSGGLEFLKPYPKLHGLSLDMTEPQFLEIVKQQELKTRKTVEGEKVTHHIALGDGHTLIVMFDKDSKCSGIQRVRGEDTPGELDPFQGTWAMDLCDSETKGFGDSQEVVKNWRWAINGNEIVWPRSKDEVWKLTFAVDPTKSPKAIDLTFLDGPHKGEKCLGMYEWGGVNKKMLLMSVQDPGAKVERPKAISMKGGGQTSLIFLQPMNAEKELASLQGTWKFQIIQTDGWPKPIGKGPDRLGRGDERQWVIKGNEITWTSPDGEEVKLSFTIDPTKSPKHFDVMFLSGPHKGQKCVGMYERGGLGGVVLWLCLTDPGSQAPRPTKVSYSTHEGRTMIGLIRVEQSEKPADKPQNGVQSLRKPALLLPDHWIVQAVGFDNDGKELITASNQSFITIRRWDVVGMKLISEIKLQGDKHGRAVRDGTLKFSGDRRRVIAATDAYVGIWDTATGKLLKQLPFQTKEGIYDCAIDMLDCTPDLSVIVGHRALPGRLTLSYDAHVIVWDGVSGNVLQTVIDKGATDLKAIDLSTDGKRLVTTNGSGAKIWETSTGQLLRSIPNDNTGRKQSEPDVSSQYTSHVWSVQFSPDGQQLAMGDTLGVKLLDATSSKLLQQLEGPYRYSSGGSPGLVFSKDGQWLARLGTQEKTEGDKHRYVVPIWSTRTGARLFELHTEANNAAFSDDGQRLAVVFSDMQQALSVWTFSGEAANVGQTAGPGPHSRQDRVEENGHYVGKTAAEFIDKFQPTWGDTKLGLQYGIALTKPQRQFRSGERVPLVVFFRNTSDQPIKFDTAPDFFGNTPKVLNAKGEPIALENIPLLGHIPHYHEKLDPGEALGPFYLNFGLGENPRPGQQHWHSYYKTPVAGQYKLTHSVLINVADQKDGEQSKRSDITTGTLEFEIVDGLSLRPQ